MDMQTHNIPAAVVKVGDVIYLRMETSGGSDEDCTHIWWLEPGADHDGTLQLTALRPERSGPLEEEFQRRLGGDESERTMQ